MLARMSRRIVASVVALGLVVVAGGFCAPGLRAQADPHAALDRILDVYVRDGLVYYAALRTERANLDRYVGSLERAEWVADAPAAEQHAFWINAYNALVLRTVINAYPVAGKADGYPSVSIAQIPGAFDRQKHTVAGRVLTLDEIEKTVITGFGDPRMLLALGRGTLGSARLRSEAYRGARLNEQLEQAVEEFVKRVDGFRIDRAAGVVTVTPWFSWREAAFVQAHKGGEMWANRSPLEKAVVALAYPHRFPSEREFLALNTFQMTFGAYDWRLNDLTGGAPIRGGKP
jgi:hypothetical protein